LYTRNSGVYPIFQPCSPFMTAYQVSRQSTQSQMTKCRFVARTTRSGNIWREKQ